MGHLGTIEQQQLNQFFQIINSSLLPSELLEQLSITTLNDHLVIQEGTADALKVKIALLRGYLGTFNADTDTPTLLDSTGIAGDSYIISVAGSHDFGSGVIVLNVDEVIEFRDSKWRIRNQSALLNNVVKLGDIVSADIHDYINANDSTDWNLTNNSVNIFTAIKNGIKEVYLYVGTLPKYMGLSQAVALEADFELTGATMLFIEGSFVIKGTGNENETTLEGTDRVFIKSITNSGDPLILFGQRYDSGDKQLRASYTQVTPIDI